MDAIVEDIKRRDSESLSTRKRSKKFSKDVRRGSSVMSKIQRFQPNGFFSVGKEMCLYKLQVHVTVHH